MKNRLRENSARISAALLSMFGEPELAPGILLNESMSYSLSSGGKRIRPALLSEFALLSGLSYEKSLPFACAVELIHTYSLIHDDLPCMDNDDYRRGRPSSHRVFGEAGALLAGDGLLTGAFELMLNESSDIPAENRLAAAGKIALCAGRLGMIGGQALDLAQEEASAEGLERISELKTGALFSAACVSGLLLAGEKDEKKLAAAENYARALGLAFQIRDDVLDVSGDEGLLGKKVGSDAKRGKRTFYGLLGPEACEARIGELTQIALESLKAFENTGFLEWLAAELVARES